MRSITYVHLLGRTLLHTHISPAKLQLPNKALRKKAANTYSVNTAYLYIMYYFGILEIA